MACEMCRNLSSNPPESLSGKIVYTCMCEQKWIKEKGKWKKDGDSPWVSGFGKPHLPAKCEEQGYCEDLG
jgi:hypothetical protein